jgi:hypothetical protein
MNPDVKKKWVEALSSGKYKQGRDALRRKDAFCCLGVLCDLASQDGTGKWGKAGDKLYHFYTEGQEKGGFLPVAVQDWAGLDDMSPGVHHEGECRALAGLNDDGLTFNQIADLIEAQL